MNTEELELFVNAKTNSIDSLEFIWKKSLNDIKKQIELIENTMDDSKFKRIKHICINQLHTTILKKIIDYKNIIPADEDEMHIFEESLYKDVLPQIPIFRNSLLKEFLFKLNYTPDGYRDPNNLIIFNCLNLDLRYNSTNIENKSPQEIINEIKKHGIDWYSDKFPELNQFYFETFHSFKTLRNEGTHESENVKQANYDFLTGARIPANSIILSNMSTQLIYFTMEILNTWIITWVKLGIIKI